MDFVRSKVLALISEQLGRDVSQDLALTLRELGADSMDGLCIRHELEKLFTIEFWIYTDLLDKTLGWTTGTVKAKLQEKQ